MQIRVHQFIDYVDVTKLVSVWRPHNVLDGNNLENHPPDKRTVVRTGIDRK